MPVVLSFGAFDPLHDGHRFFLQKAAALGDRLTVVVARDSYIRAVKQREPRLSEAERQEQVRRERAVTTVVLGDEWPVDEPYRLLRDLTFDVVALGYDQGPAEEVVREQLAQYGKGEVTVVRLDAHRPETLKSSLL